MALVESHELLGHALPVVGVTEYPARLFHDSDGTRLLAQRRAVHVLTQVASALRHPIDVAFGQWLRIYRIGQPPHARAAWHDPARGHSRLQQRAWETLHQLVAACQPPVPGI